MMAACHIVSRTTIHFVVRCSQLIQSTYGINLDCVVLRPHFRFFAITYLCYLGLLPRDNSPLQRAVEYLYW